MKKLIPHAAFFLLAGALLLGGTVQSQAHPDGYWDNHGHWRSYENYHHHRGYWDERNNNRVFINIGD